MVGMYRPDPSDTVSQNSTLTLSGYASSTGAFGVSVKTTLFLLKIGGASFLKDRWPTRHLLLGPGLCRADDDGNKEKYTAQVLTLRPTLYRQLVDNVYLGAGWSLAAQNADRLDQNDLPKIESTRRGRRYSAPVSVSI
nr:outer membrane protein/protective antigen OMA87 [Raoultella sp. NCTC 9187]